MNVVVAQALLPARVETHLDPLRKRHQRSGGTKARTPWTHYWGDISEDRLAHILSDVATLAYKWQKPLAVRLLPAPGRKSGERTQFEDSRMVNALVH